MYPKCLSIITGCTPINVATRQILQIFTLPLIANSRDETHSEEDSFMINISPWLQLFASPISCEDEETLPLSWSWWRYQQLFV